MQTSRSYPFINPSSENHFDTLSLFIIYFRIFLKRGVCVHFNNVLNTTLLEASESSSLATAVRECAEPSPGLHALQNQLLPRPRPRPTVFIECPLACSAEATLVKLAIKQSKAWLTEQPKAQRDERGDSRILECCVWLLNVTYKFIMCPISLKCQNRNWRPRRGFLKGEAPCLSLFASLSSFPSSRFVRTS